MVFIKTEKLRSIQQKVGTTSSLTMNNSETQIICFINNSKIASIYFKTTYNNKFYNEMSSMALLSIQHETAL